MKRPSKTITIKKHEKILKQQLDALPSEEEILDIILKVVPYKKESSIVIGLTRSLYLRMRGK